MGWNSLPSPNPIKQKNQPLQTSPPFPKPHHPKLTVIKYSTALSGLLKLALKHLITWSLSKPISIIPAIAVCKADPEMNDEFASPLAGSLDPTAGAGVSAEERAEEGLGLGVGVEGV